jgi:hypothetical protein
MNQCLRCKRPCAGTAVFCDGCQSSLLHRSQQKEYSTEPIFSLTGEAVIPAQPPPSAHALSGRMRIAFIAVAIAAAVVLCVDIALVLLSFSQQNHARQRLAHIPPAVAGSPGAIVPLSLSPSPFSSQSGAASAGSSPIAGATVPPGTTALPVSGTASPASSLLEISPSSLTFSVTQGQNNPGAQVVTIANAGGSTLYWQENPASSNASWLNVSPASGTLSAQQTAQLMVNTTSSRLVPGTYSTQIAVMATDSSGAVVQGSPQIFSVTLIVFQPCSVQVTPLSLSFSASLLQPNPPGQSISLKETGHCVNPSWRASVDTGGQSWLTLSATSGNQASATITTYVNAQGILPATYTGHITFTATDANGAAQGSPQVVTVTLTAL